MTLYGYARVSTAEQELALQIDALKARGVDERHIVREKISAAKERPGLAKLLARLQPGDSLVVWKLDRLGRSLLHAAETSQMLEQRGVALVITTMNIDTRTSAGKLLFGIMASVAEFERELIRERVTAGLEAAKRRGTRLGRKPALTLQQGRIAAQAIEGGKTYQELADTMGVAKSVVWNAVRIAQAAAA